MTELILTVGLPRSGKSTWANQQTAPKVCPDNIRLAIHGQAFVPSAEPFVWAVAYAMTEALFLSGHHIVIVDATNTTQKRIKEWAYKFPDVNILLKPFHTLAAECIKRAVLDRRADLVPVITRMIDNMDVDWVNHEWDLVPEERIL